MRCPNCKLENPPSAQRCDCGYDFAAGQMSTPYLSGAGITGSRGDAAAVARTYNTNIIAQRWGALILDIGVFILLFVLLHVTLNDRGDLPLILWAVAIPVYFVALEGRWGATLGKFATKIRVVDQQGHNPGYPRALVRMLLRLVEVNPILAGGLPAGVICLISKTRQRLGDMLAGTYVLYLDDVRRLRGQ